MRNIYKILMPNVIAISFPKASQCYLTAVITLTRENEKAPIMGKTNI